MPISGTEAAEVARRHGLDLSAAAALRALAETTEEADEIAASYAANQTGAAIGIGDDAGIRARAERALGIEPEPPVSLETELTRKLARTADDLETELRRKVGAEPKEGTPQ